MANPIVLLLASTTTAWPTEGCGFVTATLSVNARVQTRAHCGTGATDNRTRKPPGFHGHWYGDPEGSPRGNSCRELTNCETEFGAQGLELEGVLLGWGTDFIVDADGRWSNALAKRHVKKVPIRDPWQLRANAYRVLLTRARDVSVVFVPRIPALDATYARLCRVGFRDLSLTNDDA